MTSGGAFDLFYSEILLPKLEQLEAYREEIKKNYDGFLTLVAFGIIVVCGYRIVNDGTVTGVIVLFCMYGIPAAYIIRWRSQKIRDAYSFRFKEEIIGSIIRYHNPTLVHSPEKGIMLKAVEISTIFNDSLKRFESNDEVEGQLGKTYLQFSNVKLEHSTLGMKSKFSGLFLIARFNKKFSGDYLVISNRGSFAAVSSLEQTLQQTNLSRPPLITVENPVFRREFSVFGSDPIEAFYILTPALMQRMLDFKEKVQDEVHFSFSRSRMFVAIRGKDHIFYPPLSKQVNKKDLEAWNEGLGFALALVNDLNLNTRLWSKQ
jgi:hypothetical protein